MTTAAQAAGNPTPLEAALKVGLDTLSYNQVITFEKYQQVVLPLDGYVFWVKVPAGGRLTTSSVLNTSTLNGFVPNAPGDPSRESLVSGSSVLNTSPLNGFMLNGGEPVPPPEPLPPPDPTVLQAPGSIHYATDQRQEEDATYAVNNVIFTSQVPVTNFNALAPNELYIATFNGIRFAFSSRGRYYQQANLHHYVGDAILAPMASQVVDDPRLLDTRSLIVSNSLPGWLALNTYTKPYPIPVPQAQGLLYPSFLSPANMQPPYGTVQISPDGTEGVASAPTYTAFSNQYQASKERVTVILYGFTNEMAQSFLLNVLEYSLGSGPFSVTNIPVVKDEKRTQSELTVIAMKKRIEFEVFYYQSAIRDVARQLIEEAAVQIVASLPAPVPA